VTLFVSDLHFEPDSPDASLAERELAACIRSFGKALSRVVLVGDVFDSFIEYRSLVPKPPLRLLGALVDLRDRGVSVDYVTGNHDPWHRNWIQQEVGFDLWAGPLLLETEGLRIHAAHGDAVPLQSRFQRVIRHRWALAWYTAVLPGDIGQRLAASVSRRMRDRAVDPEISERLAEYAAGLLRTEGCDLVVLGHTHIPMKRTHGGGTYVNAGSWRHHRTLVLVEEGQVRLCKWSSGALADWAR
jgi:UDP-2,3-diacylglucosamine hydrolase